MEGVVAAAAAGKEVALCDIRGWGGEMDPETYRAHAYGKAMMILAMAEEALGEAAMKRLIGGFFQERRGASATWAGLRETLAGAHPEARSVVEQWEKPGIPSLRVEFRVQRSGGAFSVTGKVLQGGTPKPFRMAVPLVAVCGEKRVEALVKLSGAEAPFSLKCPAEPEAVVLDPEFRLLAARPAAPGAADAKKAFEDAMRVANSPGEADPRTLETTVARLRSLAEADALSGGERAACRTGIGRCLFRLGKIEEAEVELEAALRAGAGGSFHRGWVHLRLGNIADLRGRRKEAVEHYESVIRTSGSSSSAVERAKRCLERAYRGYSVDG